MAALTGAMMALVNHPYVQSRAQAEIDVVIGRDRLPNFSDKDELPYISAICREVMRWRLVTPLAVDHAAAQDDVYDGYFIPKGIYTVHVSAYFHGKFWIFVPEIGSTVVGNAW